MKLIELALPYQRKVILDNSKVKVLNFSRQIGKSWLAAYIATQKCIQKDRALVVYLSTGQRAADEALKTCLKFCDAIKVLSDGKITYTSNASCITFNNGSRIMSLPGTPTSCRGWTVDLLVADEMAFWQQPEEVWNAIVPTILNEIAGGDKEILICSTPFGKKSLFFELCQKAKYEIGWKYFEVTIEDAIKDGMRVDLEQLHKLIPDPNQFAQEFMCQFLDGVNSLIDPNLIQYYTDDVDIIDYFIGADWARTSDGTSIAVIGRTKDEKLYLIELINLHNMEYSKQIAVATEIFKKYNPKQMLGDAGGLGSPLCEQLNRTVSTRINGFNFTSTNKTDCYEYFRRSVFDRKLFINEEYRQQMNDDIALIEQVISDNGKITYTARRYNGSHADNVSALILALQAVRQNPLNVALPTSFTRHSAFGTFSSRLR